jgi:hypothetical protein
VWQRCVHAEDLFIEPALTSFFHYKQARSSPAAFNAIRNYASETKAGPTEVSSILEQRIRGVQEENGLAETGRVLSVGYANNPINSAQSRGIMSN